MGDGSTFQPVWFTAAVSEPWKRSNAVPLSPYPLACYRTCGAGGGSQRNSLSNMRDGLLLRRSAEHGARPESWQDWDPR